MNAAQPDELLEKSPRTSSVISNSTVAVELHAWECWYNHRSMEVKKTKSEVSICKNSLQTLLALIFARTNQILHSDFCDAEFPGILQKSGEEIW
jgi:hypothetical protein